MNVQDKLRRQKVNKTVMSLTRAEKEMISQHGSDFRLQTDPNLWNASVYPFQKKKERKGREKELVKGERNGREKNKRRRWEGRRVRENKWRVEANDRRKRVRKQKRKRKKKAKSPKRTRREKEKGQKKAFFSFFFFYWKLNPPCGYKVMPSEILHTRHGEHDSSQDKPAFSILLFF